MKTMLMIGAALAAGLLATAAQAQWHVDVNYDGFNGASDGTASRPFTTITAGVAAANAGGSTTVLIAGGTYLSDQNGGNEDFGTGGINFTKSMTFRGGFVGQVDGATFDWSAITRVPRSTIIDLDGAGSRAFYGSSTVTFDGFTFQNASHGLPDGGGAIYKVNSFSTGLTVRNCLFTNNVATAGQGGALSANTDNQAVLVEDCEFIDNSAPTGGALRSVPTSSSATIRRCYFSGNQATSSSGGGGAISTSGSNVIEDSTFVDNTASGYGGATRGPATIRRSTFMNNASTLGASVAEASGFSSQTLILENCLMIGNSGVYTLHHNTNQGGSLQIRHCTLVDNVNSTACVNSGSHLLLVKNSIVANNGPRGIRRTGSSTTDVNYNNVLGHTTADYEGLTAGSNDISVDPDFVDAGGGDYRLAKGSPCIDAGTDAGVTEDFDGVMRPTRAGFDMGAYEEWQVPVIAYYHPTLWTDQARPRAAFSYIADAYPSHAFIVLDGTGDQGTGSMGAWDQESGDLGVQTVDILFGHTFTGLSPNTTYYYRIVASNDYDLAWGPLGTFTTPLSGTTRTWTGLGADELASTPENWSGDTIPGWTDHVVLNSTTNKNLFWDGGQNGLSHGVASWTQTTNYTGTVTFDTRYDGQGDFFDFTVTGDAAVTNGTWMQPLNPDSNTATYRLRINVGSDFTLGEDALISGKARGYRRYRGPGGGTGTTDGGTHGGIAGNSNVKPYGSVTQPVDLGSGGGQSDTLSIGGGALYLTVGQHASFQGRINMDSADNSNSGHGAGGSIYIEAATIAGTATAELTASCGLLGWGGRSRGGGGRIAIVLTDPAATFAAFGDVTLLATTRNLDGAKGGAGTIYLQRGDQADGTGQLLIDNAGVSGNYTGTGDGLDLDALDTIEIVNGGRLRIYADDTINLDTANLNVNAILQLTEVDGVTVASTWVVEDHTYLVQAVPSGVTRIELGGAGSRTLYLQTALALDSLLVKTDANLATYNEPLTVSGNAEIETGGSLHADFMGFAPKVGPGFTNNGSRDGGSYGGRGGERNSTDNGVVGPCYGSILNPLLLGSGGENSASSGGGVLKLVVDGTLTVNGRVSARGDGTNESSGSGGSVNIRAAELAGSNASASIDARGGQNGGYGGGGGGGRVAIVITGAGNDFSTFAGTIYAWAYGGQPDYRNGGGGTVYRATIDDGEAAGSVTVDFNGISTVHGWCELPPSFAGSGTYPADTYAFNDDITKTTVDMKNSAKVILMGNQELSGVTIDGSSTLDLNGQELLVRGPVVINGQSIKGGEHSAASLGLAQVTDSAGTDGRIVIPPPGSLFLMR